MAVQGFWCFAGLWPQLERDGKAKTDPVTGKILYVPVIEWASKELRDRFSEAVLSAIRNAGHRLGDES